MGALHVVGIDLKHRLGEHPCLLGGTEVLVGHLRFRLLGSMLHQYPSGKGPRSLIIEHVFIEFVRSAVGGTVCDERVVVYILLFVGNNAAVAMTLSSLTRECQVKLVAGHAIVQRDDVMGHAAVALLVDVDVADTNVLIVGFFQTVEI